MREAVDFSLSLAKRGIQASPNGWPTDAVEISNEEYLALFEGQSEGHMITVNKDGYPVLCDSPPPTSEQLRQTVGLKNSN